MKLREINKPDLSNVKDFGLVLCGGGAAGRWQAGVLIGMVQLGLFEKVSFITGTSVGGLNAALFANYYKDINKIISIWESITKNEHVYKGDLNSFFGKVGSVFSLLFNNDCLLDPQPLYNLIDSHFKDMTLKELYEKNNIHLIVSSLDLNRKKEEFYSSFNKNKDLKIADVLKRTSAIPIIFKSVKSCDIGEKVYHWHIDGGVGANNPLIAINEFNSEIKKVKKIIIIYCYPDEDKTDNKEYRGIRDIILALIPAFLSAQEQMAEEWAKAVVKYGFDILAIYPDKVPCNSLDFTKTYLLQEGYDHFFKGEGYSYKEKTNISIEDFLNE